MISIIETTIYKILKEKLNYIIPIVFVGMAVIEVWYKFDSYTDNPYLVPLLFMPRSVIWFGILSGVYCGYNIGRDFLNRTIKNMLMLGLNRTKIYLSHFIVHAVILFVLSLIATGVVFLGLGLQGAFVGALPENYFFMVMIYILILLQICISMSAVFTMISFVVNNFVAAAAGCATYMYVEVLVILICGEERLSGFAKVLPILSLSSLKVTIYNELFLTPETLTRIVCGILFVVICTAIGIVRFKRAEYK